MQYTFSGRTTFRPVPVEPRLKAHRVAALDARACKVPELALGPRGRHRQVLHGGRRSFQACGTSKRGRQLRRFRARVALARPRLKTVPTPAAISDLVPRAVGPLTPAHTAPLTLKCPPDALHSPPCTLPLAACMHGRSKQEARLRRLWRRRRTDTMQCEPGAKSVPSALGTGCDSSRSRQETGPRMA